MRYVRQKLVQVVIVLLATTFLSVFLMRQVKGADPAIAISGGLVSDPKALEEIRHKWSLDKPVVVQWGRWLKNMAKGDLGHSSAFGVSVTSLLRQRLPTTLYLMVYTQLLSLLIAIPLGVYAAYRPNRLFDRVSSSVAFGLLSVPNFVVAVVLVLFFSLRFHWFPAVSTYYSLFNNPSQHIRNFLLPTIANAVGQVAIYMRLLRADMVTTLQNDFITMARAKGLPSSRILFRHAFRPSTFSLITAAAVNVGALIGGVVITEQLFALPGVGKLTVDAIFRRDFLVLQACVALFAIAFVVVNFAVDMAYAFIDPRIRHARALA